MDYYQLGLFFTFLKIVDSHFLIFASINILYLSLKQLLVLIDTIVQQMMLLTYLLENLIR